MDAEETLKVISKQWCDLKDIMHLAQVGRNSALKIKQAISTTLKEQGYYIPKNLIPTTDLVKYLKIDINYLRKITDVKNTFE